MESKVLENLKENFMKDKILEALKIQLDAKYKEYMDKDYPERLAVWEERSNWDERAKPQERKPTEFFLTKTKPYLDKLNLSDEDDFVIMVNTYQLNVTIIIYLLTKNGMLTKIETYNGEPPDQVDYKVSRDISKVEFEGKRKAIFIYDKNRRWESAGNIVFESEDAAHDFYTKLNDFRNGKPGFKNKSNKK